MSRFIELIICWNWAWTWDVYRGYPDRYHDNHEDDGVDDDSNVNEGNVVDNVLELDNGDGLILEEDWPSAWSTSDLVVPLVPSISMLIVVRIEIGEKRLLPDDITMRLVAALLIIIILVSLMMMIKMKVK